MLTPNTIPAPNPNIIGRVVDNEAVLVMPNQGKVKVLNEVGAAIWQLIDGRRDIQQIVVELCTQFEITPDIAETDARKFITELAQRKIIDLPEEN